MKDRTTLIIAHRLSTIENSDVIMVLDQGNILALDTPEAIKANNAALDALVPPAP